MLTCKWLLTSSLVRPSTFISSRICFGVATACPNPSINLYQPDTYISTVIIMSWPKIISLVGERERTVRPAQLLQGLEEPAMELRRPAPPGLAVMLLLRRLPLFAVFLHVLVSILDLLVCHLSVAGSLVPAAVSDHRGARRGRGRRRRQLGLGALLLLKRVERSPGLGGVQRHGLAWQLLAKSFVRRSVHQLIYLPNHPNSTSIND